jgi:uncharacterized membrane protein YbaN (DUF454 family)
LKIFEKYKDLTRKDKSNLLLLVVVAITISIWILAANQLFHPLLAMFLMILMIVIVLLDMKNKSNEEKEKMK